MQEFMQNKFNYKMKRKKTYPEEVNKRMILFQELKGLTNIEFAMALELTDTTSISRIRQMKPVPEPLVNKFILKFNINPDWLLYGKEPIEKDNKDSAKLRMADVAGESLDLYENKAITNIDRLNSELKSKDELVASLQDHIKDLQANNSLLRKILTDLTTKQPHPREVALGE